MNRNRKVTAQKAFEHFGWIIYGSTDVLKCGDVVVALDGGGFIPDGTTIVVIGTPTAEEENQYREFTGLRRAYEPLLYKAVAE